MALIRWQVSSCCNSLMIVFLALSGDFTEDSRNTEAADNNQVFTNVTTTQ